MSISDDVASLEPSLSATERKYQQHWRTWSSYAERAGFAAMPARPADVAAFLAERIAAGQAISTLRVAIGAIRSIHEASGAGFDSKAQVIVDVLQGATQTAAPKVAYRMPSQDWLIANSVTIEDVEWRMLRAINTIRSIPDPDARFRGGLRAVWPTFTQDFADLSWNWNTKEERSEMEKRAQKFRPTPRDNSDCLKALEWLRGVPTFLRDGIERPYPHILSYADPLTRKEIQLLGWQAAGYGPSFIASKLNTSKQNVHRKYKDTIIKVFNAAIQHALEEARRAARRTEISGPSLKDDLAAYNAKATEGSGGDRREEGPIRL